MIISTVSVYNSVKRITRRQQQQLSQRKSGEYRHRRSVRFKWTVIDMVHSHFNDNGFDNEFSFIV